MENLILSGCIILDKDSKILLIHRQTKKRQQWETPGGKVEPGEPENLAAIREAKEEIGVDVKIIKEMGRKEFTEDGYTLLYIWYLAEIDHGTPFIVETDRYDDIKYFDWNELFTTSKTLSPNVKNLIGEYQKGSVKFL